MNKLKCICLDGVHLTNVLCFAKCARFISVFIFVNFARRAKIYLLMNRGKYYQRVSRNSCPRNFTSDSWSLFVNQKPCVKANLGSFGVLGCHAMPRKN